MSVDPRRRREGRVRRHALPARLTRWRPPPPPPRADNAGQVPAHADTLACGPRARGKLRQGGQHPSPAQQQMGALPHTPHTPTHVARRQKMLCTAHARPRRSGRPGGGGEGGGIVDGGGRSFAALASGRWANPRCRRRRPGFEAPSNVPRPQLLPDPWTARPPRPKRLGRRQTPLFGGGRGRQTGAQRVARSAKCVRARVCVCVCVWQTGEWNKASRPQRARKLKGGSVFL